MAQRWTQCDVDDDPGRKHKSGAPQPYPPGVPTGKPVARARGQADRDDQRCHVHRVLAAVRAPPAQADADDLRRYRAPEPGRHPHPRAVRPRPAVLVREPGGGEVMTLLACDGDQGGGHQDLLGVSSMRSH